MMMNEFIERTGFEPTAEEYAEIEEQYYSFDGDKDAFCEHWKDGQNYNRRLLFGTEHLPERLQDTRSSGWEISDREMLKNG